jgi:hypothetical protein
VDIISARFFDFKGRNAKTKTFAPKKGAEVYLCISYEKYDVILTHLSELDFNELEGQQVCHIWSCEPVVNELNNDETGYYQQSPLLATTTSNSVKRKEEKIIPRCG